MFSLKPMSSAITELSNRVESQARASAVELDGRLRSIHFLRGVHSRAQYALVAFYVLMASDIESRKACSVPGHAGVVLQSYVNQSALSMLSLACRKVFDHSRKGMTGANFGRSSDSILEEHATYWSKTSGRKKEEALAALSLLRRFFLSCSRQSNELFKESGTLGRRVGLIKQYADRSAAHISLDNYTIDILDLAHVVAAMCLVGEIIRSFDGRSSESEFNDIDEASWKAAKHLFPDTPNIRLFGQMRVAQQAMCCWTWSEDEGMHMLTEQLPFAISWY